MTPRQLFEFELVRLPLRFVNLILTGILTVGSFLSPTLGHANSCELMFVKTVTTDKKLLDRVAIQPRELTESEANLAPELQPGGRLRIEEKPFSEDPKSALLEFIAMTGANRQKTFSVKDFDRGGPADTGTFTLGIPLIGNYSVEAIYNGDYRTGPYFKLSGVKLVPPFGKPINVSTNPLTLEGKINPRLYLDLTAFPDLAPYDVTTAVPTIVNMDALIKAEQLKNQLPAVEKAEMRRIAESNGYVRLRAMMLHRYVKAKMIEYHAKGVFKRWVAWISFPLIAYIGYVMLPDSVVTEIRDFIMNPDPFETEKALNEFASVSGLPEPIREQIVGLRQEVIQVIDPTGAKSRELTKKQGLDLDANSRFDVSKSQSVWIQHMYDKDKGKDVTLLYMSRYNGTSRVDITAVEVDSVRYQPLIKYIESRGDFMIFNRSELKK